MSGLIATSRNCKTIEFAMTGELHLQLLGTPTILRDGVRQDFHLRRATALLAYLAVTGQAQPRDHLAELFWPEAPPGVGRTRLRRLLHRITQAIGRRVITANDDQLTLGDAIDTDRQVYLDLLAQAAAAEDPLQEAALLRESFGLYRGEFLHAFALPECGEFDRWQQIQADELRHHQAATLSRLARLEQAAGCFDPAIDCARKLVALDRLEESSQQLLIGLYMAAGRPSAARAQLAECRRILAAELDLEPSPETLALIPEPIRSSQSGLPRTHYAESNGAHIAWQVTGSGARDVLLIPGFVSHLEQFWLEPTLAGFLSELASGCRLILLDRRGIGLSDRTGGPPTSESTCEDIDTVLQAANSSSAVIFGVSEGGPMALEFAARHPESVDGVMVFGAMAKGLRSDNYPWGLAPQAFNRWLDQLIADWGGPAGLEHFAPSMADDPQLRDWWARTLRLGSSPGAVRFVLEALSQLDIRALLSSINVPSLVIHRRGDLPVPFEAGRYLAQLIPGARWRPLDGCDHWPWFGDSASVLDAIGAFLAELDALPSDVSCNKARNEPKRLR
jgi:DNA-binding SARP family transcriptional activator/pimeloyl-ACP methyl ester carboxylesterase